jgi:hypothetical protein
MVNNTENAPASPSAQGPGGVNTGVAVIGFFLCFLAGVALMWGYYQHRIRTGDITVDLSGESAGGAWDDSDSPIPVSSKDPMWGKRDAPVTIVMWSDFQCPYCSRVEPTLQHVKDAYGPDKVRIIWKNYPLPFHQNAKPAAEAAVGVFEMAGNDAFWKWHDSDFKNQQSMSTRQLREVGAGRRRQGHRGVQGGARRPQVGRQGRQGQERRRCRRHAGHAGLLRQRRVH